MVSGDECDPDSNADIDSDFDYGDSSSDSPDMLEAAEQAAEQANRDLDDDAPDEHLGGRSFAMRAAVPTPAIVGEGWKDLEGEVVLEWGIGLQCFRYNGENHRNFPVYEASPAEAGGRAYTIYREGTTWYYTTEPAGTDRFDKRASVMVSKIEHDKDSDPNLPPSGFGWLFYKDGTANPNLSLSLAPEFNRSLLQLHPWTSWWKIDEHRRFAAMAPGIGTFVVTVMLCTRRLQKSVPLELWRQILSKLRLNEMLAG